MLEQALRGGTALLDPLSILNRLDLRDGYVVADLGCGGGGHFVGPLAKLVGAKGLVYAVDIQKNVLLAVQAKMRLQGIENVKTVWSDLERPGATDIADESCEVVMIINVLFQNEKHDTILQEATRMIKSGGRLVVIDWKPSGSPFGPSAQRRISPHRIMEIAKSLQLGLQEEFDAGPYHYALVFKK